MLNQSNDKALENDNFEGATPLSPDEMLRLKYKHVNTREQLNELEAANILQGQIWINKLNNPTIDTIFKRDFIIKLHIALFGDVWQWAGEFRQRELNIGVAPENISTDLHNFLEDAKCWITFHHFEPLELSARIHHRLVQIHPFTNGNGRHSRIFTDIVRLFILKEPTLTWAKMKLEDITNERGAYISSLKKADNGDFSNLIQYLKNLGN